MCEVAAGHGGTVIDDIVPGHTGKGADFRLAEMKVGDYPGIYHMVEIPETDWHLLPDGAAGAGLGEPGLRDAEDRLAEAGYIIGPLQRVIFYEPGRQGHQLVGHGAGRSVRTGRSTAGSTCTTSRRASPR